MPPRKRALLPERIIKRIKRNHAKENTKLTLQPQHLSRLLTDLPARTRRTATGLTRKTAVRMVTRLRGRSTAAAGPAVPAKLIKKYIKAGSEKPALKGAYVQECAFVGSDKLEELINIKSREELIGDIVALLQSPIKSVVSALQNGGGQLVAGLIKTLEEREN